MIPDSKLMPETRDAFIIHKRARQIRSVVSQSMRALAGKRPARPGQRLIFTVTNGRSGSNMLANLFGAFRDMTALHEPEPDFRHLRPIVVARPWIAGRWLEYVKMPAIAALPGSTYVETSHMFCKGYFEPMVDLGYDFDLINLVRPARQIALSMVQLPSIPGTTRWADSFYVSPTEPNLLPIRGPHSLTEYQLCYWHALENEARQRHYVASVKARGGIVADIETRNLSDRGAVIAFFEALALDLGNLDEDKLDRLLDTRSNLKLHEKVAVKLDPAKLDEEEADVRDRIGQ